MAIYKKYNFGNKKVQQSRRKNNMVIWFGLLCSSAYFQKNFFKKCFVQYLGGSSNNCVSTCCI